MDTREPRHTPVLVQEVLGFLRPEREGLYVDGTVGLGGHAEAVLRHGHERLRLIGMDRDAEALEACRERLGPWARRVTLVHLDYREGPDFLKKGERPAASSAGCSTSDSALTRWTIRRAASPSGRTGPWT